MGVYGIVMSTKKTRQFVNESFFYAIDVLNLCD